MSRSLGFSSVTTRSPMVISPSVTSSRPAIMRRMVVLPQPDGPTSTMNSPSPISRDTSRTACTPPGNSLLTWSRTILPISASSAVRGRDRSERPEALMGEGGTKMLGGSRTVPEPVEAEERRPDHRRGGDLGEPGGRGDLADRRADPLEEGRGLAMEQAAAEHHLDVG